MITVGIKNISIDKYLSRPVENITYDHFVVLLNSKKEFQSIKDAYIYMINNPCIFKYHYIKNNESIWIRELKEVNPQQGINRYLTDLGFKDNGCFSYYSRQELEQKTNLVLPPIEEVDNYYVYEMRVSFNTVDGWERFDWTNVDDSYDTVMKKYNKYFYGSHRNANLAELEYQEFEKVSDGIL